MSTELYEDSTLHRSIVGFHQDLEQHWVAELDCGHCQHTRHEPPFFPRPWVITAEGRAEHIGQILNCVLCDRQEMPDGFIPDRLTSIAVAMILDKSQFGLF